MFQNSYQNGIFFEVFDPKRNTFITQFLKTKLRTYISYKMPKPITKFLIRI